MGARIVVWLVSSVIAATVAYCIYFDQKRRRDPEFKKKLTQKRVTSALSRDDSKVQVLNLQDQEVVQDFVFQNFQQGQQLLRMNKIDEGIHCMATALAICGQQDMLLQMVRPAFPPVIYNMLCEKVNEVHQKMVNSNGNCVKI
ncbi:Mitochondrial import receptor subunit tom20 [Nesidiocoris tenuis]|uniref:Mitochondrial import receptor subunit tom20 n=1 Tax=Nesidiocoris tenuis TaxID=355587 RepID=A0ABN7AN11_9HEMI|nr:Mitochondrial import receptor subunit tom20 [Nesidiocoris tenuis]